LLSCFWNREFCFTNSCSDEDQVIGVQIGLTATENGAAGTAIGF
jgi:hypothetical protein